MGCCHRSWNGRRWCGCLEPEGTGTSFRHRFCVRATRWARLQRYGLLTFSSDGSKFVYNATGGLYLRSIDELESRVISGTEGVLDGPTFSPDGEWLGYWSAQDSQLRKIAAVGGSPVSLTETPTRPFGITWDVDDTILYDTAEGIMRVSADGGEPELLLPRLEGRLGFSQLLPGGNAVLFEIEGEQVGVQSLDSEEARVLFPGESSPFLVETLHGSRWVMQPSSSISSTSSPQFSARA